MAEKIKFITHDKYLEVIYTGERTYEEFIGFIERSYLKCNETNHNKILVNMLGAKGTWKQFDRFKVGEHIALHFRGNYKISVIEHKDIINKFVENAAVNRGVTILVTHDKEASLEWLLADGRPR